MKQSNFIKLFYKDLEYDIQNCPNRVVGAWIKILCYLWEKKTYRLEGTLPQIGKVIGENPQETEIIITYIEKDAIADVERYPGKYAIICRRLEREHNAKKDAIENDDMLFPDREVKSDAAPEKHSNYYVAVIKLWNTFAKKTASPDDINTQYAVVATANEIGEKALLDCIDNYRAACELEKSQAWPFNLWKFSRTGYLKFRQGVFDIDNYDITKFRPEETDTKDKIGDAMEYS